MPVLLLAEGQPVQVRAPNEPFHDCAPRSGIAQRVRDLRAARVQRLVGISAPIGEHHQVVRTDPTQTREQLREVHPSMNKLVDSVARGPSSPTHVPTIDPRRRITAFVRAQEPVLDVH